MQSIALAIELGSIQAILVLAVLVSFRILDWPDLSVDGSMVTGGAISAVLLTRGVSPIASLPVAFVGGAIVGAAVSIAHDRLGINRILAGVIGAMACYSLNIFLMSGRPNLSLIGLPTLAGSLEVGEVYRRAALFLAAFGVVAAGIGVLLKSDFGLVMRASGENETLLAGLAFSPPRARLLGMSVSNGIAALSGGLLVQDQGFCDVNMGLGAVLGGITALLLGQTLFRVQRKAQVIRSVASCLAGAIAYQLILAGSLRLGFPPYLLKALIALLVVGALWASAHRRGAA